VRRLVLLVVLLAAAPADAGVVRSGPLEAHITADPWRLDFSGGPAQAAPLGGATRALSERFDGAAYVATLATGDPTGKRIEVRVEPVADGVIRVSAAGATSAGFTAAPGERLLGFGERSNAVDQRGGQVESYVAEGPYQPSERAAIAGFVPPPGYRPRDDASYFPMPWLLSTRGFGVLVRDDETSRFDLTPGDRWSVDVDGDTLVFEVFAGPTPAGVLRRLTDRLGRQPPAAAPFYFGPWFQPKGDEASSLAALRKADAPASVAQTYTHYLPCGDHQGKRDAQRARTALFHAAGLAVTTYFNPMICTSYAPRFDEASAAGALTKNALGRPYTYRYTGASQFLVGQFDFSAPTAVALYARLLGEAVEDGYDGWMEDFGEYTPIDAVSADGTPGPQMHNRYPALYHGAAYAYAQRAPRPLARFNRSGWTGAARVSQIVWGGDPSTGWGFDGLASAVRNGLTMGLSGVSLWGSDIGGFFALSLPQTTSELLARWIEVGFASGVMRTQANGFDLGNAGRRAQIFDADVLPVWRRYAKLRTQLYPYLAAAEREYDRSGLPLMRHLALAYPDDARAVAREDEYLLGGDLLVAPVLEPGATERRAYLPAGRWIDLWRSAAVRADGSLSLRRARVLKGGDVTLPAPLAELPLLVRAGALLPLLSPDVQTLSDYGGAGVVRLRDREDRLAILAWPRDATSAEVGTGGRLVSREGRRRWTLSAPAGRHVDLQASLGALRRPFTPCRLRVGRRTLSRRAWTYDPTARVLRARYRARRAALVVAGC
jgi:alpha-glucosidase